MALSFNKRYAGTTMRLLTPVLPGVGRLGRAGGDLSVEGRRRLGWIDWYQDHGRNARKACRHFSISPDTFYRALRRYNPRDLASLESRSRRPRRLRQPTWSADMKRKVLELREQYPRWGKDKLVVLLRREGLETSTSMVGRILKKLKDRGILREPVISAISARKRQQQRPYAVRKPKGYKAEHPGDLVEVDTLDVRPCYGVVLKHFTARDVVSRYDVLEVHSRARASTAAHFLDALQTRMPFPVRAIQVDGGSEYQSEFEMECQKRNLLLYVLPPRSPKLNVAVERAQRTHTEEFYEVYDGDIEIRPLSVALQGWEYVYNHIRPHQALGYLTPVEYLAQHHTTTQKVETKPNMVTSSPVATGHNPN